MKIGIAYSLISKYRNAFLDRPEMLDEYDSDETVKALETVFVQNGYDVCLLGDGEPFIDRVKQEKPNIVFNIAEGYGHRNREAQIPVVLEILGIPYTHSDSVTTTLTMDKGLAKKIIKHDGINTPPFTLVNSVLDLNNFPLSFPVIVKLALQGCSIGVDDNCRCDNFSRLSERVSYMLERYGESLLIEEYCGGLEFTVGILGYKESATVLGCMGIEPLNGDLEQFVYSSYRKKDSLNRVKYKFQNLYPEELITKVNKIALQAYKSLGCRDVGRVDIRLDKNAQPAFLEINPLPGLNPESSDMCILAYAAGETYSSLILKILGEAKNRLFNPV